MNDLEHFLQINSIDADKLYEAVHLDIRETLLKVICESMKADSDMLLKVKRIYYSNSDLEATRAVVNSICKCTLSDNDLFWMNMCIKAFLDKKSKREQISESVKKQLLNNQNQKCAICGKSLDMTNIHVDHIIPWDYVGDEIENNYQALCQDCNLHKSNHVAITVTNLVLHRTEV